MFTNKSFLLCRSRKLGSSVSLFSVSAYRTSSCPLYYKRPMSPPREKRFSTHEEFFPRFQLDILSSSLSSSLSDPPALNGAQISSVDWPLHSKKTPQLLSSAILHSSVSLLRQLFLFPALLVSFRTEKQFSAGLSASPKNIIYEHFKYNYLSGSSTQRS